MPRLMTRILILAFPALIAFAQDDVNRAPWYRPPQLFVMTGFIANTTTGVWGADFIVNGEWTPEKQQAALAAWRKGLGARYDADRVARAFQEAGATGVIFYDKWHDGLVNHDTRLTGFKTETDLVGPTVAALKKHGLRSVIYYSVGLDYNPEPRFLEWACRDADGKPMGLAFASDWMSFHSPYRRYVIDQLVELVRNYGPLDGLWLDLFTQPSPVYLLTRGRGLEYSHDKHTAQAFQAKFGKAMAQGTSGEIEDFVVDTMREFLLEIRGAARQAQPGISITWNGAGMDDVVRPNRAARMNAPADFFSMEGHSLPNIDLGARVGHAMDRPFEVGMLLNSSWYVPMSDQAPPAAMSEEEAIVSAATAWIQGANVYAAMTPGHAGEFDPNGDLRLLRAAGAWLKDNREWLAGTVPYADVGVVLGRPSDRVHQPPLLAELWRASHRGVMDASVQAAGRPGQGPDRGLRKAGYFTEWIGGSFAARKFRLDSYRLLVLPETALVDDILASEIREYVRRGGNLLAFGHASLFDQHGGRRGQFALADVFGAEFAGTLPGYKQFSPLGASGIQSTLSQNPGALAVRATNGTPLAVWKSADDAPALIENRFGQGRCLYSSAEEIVFGEGSALLEELAARLIGPPPIEVTAGREYAMLMNRKGADSLLYLLNRSTGSRTSYGSSAAGPPIRHVSGKERILLSLNTSLLGDLGGVEEIPGNRALSLSRTRGNIRVAVDAFPTVTTLRLIPAAQK